MQLAGDAHDVPMNMALSCHAGEMQQDTAGPARGEMEGKSHSNNGDRVDRSKRSGEGIEIRHSSYFDHNVIALES